MTRLRDELRLLAAEAPQVDLAERAVRGARRQKTTTFASVVAALAALAVSAAILVDGSRGATTSTQVTDVLPASGVDPAAYAYYDFCGRKWDYRKNTHTFAGQNCAQWQLVTRTGQRFRVPEATSVYTEQTADNYMNTGAPLVITPDGRRIAYYSEKDRTFAVRDLAGGQIWLAPLTVTRQAMVRSGVLLTLSPDGRYLGVNGPDRLDAVVDVETGQLTEPPNGWRVRRVASGGTSVVMSDLADGLGLMSDGKVTPLTIGKPWDDITVPAPDEHTMAYLDGRKDDGNGMFSPDNAVATLDATTGKTLTKVTFRDAPKDFTPRLGGWLSPTEVAVSDAARGPRSEDGTPMLGEVVYGIDVNTGKVRERAKYTYRGWAGDLSIPGF
ncbi:hypothetical protein ABT294_39085 [Nonomuraea sp. NPDC000554]|uniref:hypothetical protein n=1 Tax=Nonomuraea sp. NPDC000554 TaxID=3154259 RepID=UPI00331DEC75